ncbi:hypothetical protein CASFOL_005052 [Castilleja foliolosa]|uniref:CCHC-type domain-containing protein n=1 Tax=Castilleja foliolosa TaxID=1961234 RepID=A0ABD3E6E6_9LAMI
MSMSKEIDYLTDELEIHCLQTEETPAENNEYTLIAKIITQKTTNLNAFKNSILRSWNPPGKVLTNNLQNNTMAFIFNKEEDIIKILNATWTFRDQQIVVARWPPDKSLPEIDLNKILFWVHVFGIPVCYANLNTAQAIGGMIGKFVKSDINLATQKWKKSIRIQVELDINQPLISSMVLYCNSKSRFQTEIRYERLTDFCYRCGLLGHKIISCSNPMTDIPKRVADNVFGPWMKIENTHIMNPKFLILEAYPDQRNPNLKASGSTPTKSPQESPMNLHLRETNDAPSAGTPNSDQEMTGEGVAEGPTAEIENSKENSPVNISGQSLQNQKQKDVEIIPQKELSLTDTSSTVEISQEIGVVNVNPNLSLQKGLPFSDTEDLEIKEKMEFSTNALNANNPNGPMDLSNKWASSTMGLSLKRKFETPAQSGNNPRPKDSSSPISDFQIENSQNSPNSQNPNFSAPKRPKIEQDKEKFNPTLTYSVHRNPDGSPKLIKNHDSSKVSSSQTKG